MELLDRYLQAIGKHLPAKRRADIVEELRANLLAEAEDMQEKLGRPLRAEEEEALIKHHGHPAVVAARYSTPQYLIGPTMFPYYWLALRTALGIAMLIYAIINGILYATGTLHPERVVSTVLGFAGVAMQVAIWVTIVFVALEFVRQRFGTKFDFMDSWNPRQLPRVEATPDKRMKAPVADFFLHASFAIYLMIAVRHPFLLIGPGVLFFQNSPLQLAPVLYSFYWAFLAMAVAQAALHGLYIGVRRTRPLRMYTDAIAKAFGFAIVVLLIRVHDFFVVSPTAADPASAQHTAQVLNPTIVMGLKMVAAIIAVTSIWKVYEWATNRGGARSSRSSQVSAGVIQ
jgi:hypothetical protein